jgi:potassium-transporting ATPase KdpC subunit
MSTAMLRRQVRPAIMLTLILCVVTGALYPGIVTLLAQLFFPRQANGSLVSVNGRVVGSTLIGQSFTQPRYFHGRRSAAGRGYDASASGATNRGPTDHGLADTLITGAVEAAIADGAVRGRVPADMATTSASGLDPHISPANAFLQVGRVARARAADSAAVLALVRCHVEGRQFGFLGEPRVNVLLLNIALDAAFDEPPSPSGGTTPGHGARERGATGARGAAGLP